MFILDDPFVSAFLRDSVLEAAVPVLDTPMARRTFRGSGLELHSSAEFAALAESPGARLYTNSENAIDWIASHLADTPLPHRVAVFKDKVAFRELVRPLFPDYTFLEVTLRELGSIDPAKLPMPCVIKPAAGFFSIGVHRVSSPDEWPETVDQLRQEVAQARGVYPSRVIELDRFIIEEVVEGEEFAVDAYFDGAGELVVLDILGHLFADEGDVSDRVYFTSPALIERVRHPLTAFLRRLGTLGQLRNFPFHAELRLDASGTVAPIEVNPLRFGGWCASDIAWHAWGINPYLMYMNDARPDWPKVLKQRAGRATALIVADLPVDLDRKGIATVDYSAFERRFSQPLELRRLDFRRYPVFAFLFVEVPENDFSELEEVLHADLTTHLERR